VLSPKNKTPKRASHKPPQRPFRAENALEKYFINSKLEKGGDKKGVITKNVG
jgi:hypothetical protein